MVTRLTAGVATASVVLLCAPAAVLGHALPTAASARLTGSVTVSISSPRLKHWGVPGGLAAFVPAADRSAQAERIRKASGASALCAAISAASGEDPHIPTATLDGDANLEHRSGDEELMTFVVVVRNPSVATRGSLYVCSEPAFAMMSRGPYPNERYYRANADHRLQWKSGPLTLRPGERVPVRFTWNVDASNW